MNSHLLDARYRILAVLSAEELTQTYLVEDSNLPESQFILKQLHPANKNPQDLNILRRLFTGEAETLEKLTQAHNQLQKLVTYFAENEEFYLVQEFVSGHSLTEEILQGIPLEEEQVINLLLELLEILVFVHSYEVIHQDIQPSNIIRRDSDNKLVLIDFSSVRELVTTTMGNLEYIPIEQLQGHPQYNSDIYALGIMTIAALQGLTEDEISLLISNKNILTGEIIWRNNMPQINQELAKIIDKMIRFDYRKRYQSANEVIDDLKQINDGDEEPKQEKPKLQKPWLLLTGIASFLALGTAAWFFLTPKPVGDAKLLYLQGVDKYERNDYQGAIKDLTQALEINPKDAQAYNARGDAFYQLKDYQKAQLDASKAIELNSKDANAYYDRGFSHYQLGKYKEAIADHSKAIQLNAKNPYTYYGRGLAYVGLKDPQKAMADFNKAIALQPNYSGAYLQRGILRRRLGQTQTAIQDFDTTIEMNPHDSQAFLQRGLTHFANNDRELALKDYNSAIELNSKYIEAYLNRGDIYSELGKNLEATEDYNKALELDPKSSLAYLHRGMHRFSLGNYQGAIADYNEAIKLNPKNGTAYNNRGNAHLESGDKKAAIADYSKAIAVRQNFALAYYNRGLVRVKNGDKKGAIADFQQAAKIFKQRGQTSSYKDAQREIKNLQK